MKHYIGIDNGVTGSIGIIHADGSSLFYRTPIKKELSYTKEEKHISRIDVPALREILKPFGQIPENAEILLERPMVNPRRFTASLSAIRALEATMIVLEELNLYKRFVDSREWQSVLLPGVEGSDQLKKASLELGQKLYPNLKFKSDADSLLMAHWACYGRQSTKKKEL
jgi:hypothetical protein